MSIAAASDPTAPAQPWLVLKFGGTSVSKRERWDTIVWLDHRALAAVDHAEQVIRPVGQAPRALIAEADVRRLPQAFADFVDQGVGHIEHQHGVGGEPQGAMVEHQADPAEQPLLMPLAHLPEHLVFVGVDPFGELLIGPRDAGQAAFQMTPQSRGLPGVQSGLHGLSPRANPRSMR